VLVAIAVVATAFALSGDDAPSSSAPGTGAATTRGVAEVGDLAPDFTLTTLAGETVQLSEYRGSPVIVNFWASWCVPCREEFPVLQDALDEHERAGLAIVGVTYRDIASDSRAFVREMDATWPQGIDERGDVAGSYGVRAIPLTFYVDADGRITDRVFGGVTERQMSEALEEILPA
jgi:cytochrome c biogenesis protein CcmG/thiol:disulfide interchange protein DsbE